MGLFIGVSIAWGLLFMYDVLEMWHAVVLLILHGLAGVLWAPATQLLVHDIVGHEQLHSAIRLNATARYLGLLGGPAVGSGMMLLIGPANGILLNALIYLPLVLWLWKAPYGPRFREGEEAHPRRDMRGFEDLLATARSIVCNRVLVSMTLLGGAAAFFVAVLALAFFELFFRDVAMFESSTRGRGWLDPRRPHPRHRAAPDPAGDGTGATAPGCRGWPQSRSAGSTRGR